MSHILRSYFLAALVLMLVVPVSGQLNNTLYYMYGVPQVNRVNPSAKQMSNFYLGVPVLSTLRVETGSSSISYQDIIYPHPTQDSLITFLHPDGNKEAFMNQLKPLNLFISDAGASLFSLGFNTRAGFFSLDISTRFEGNVMYPGDLFRLVLNGAEEGETYNMDGTAINASVFDEISLGWSGEIFDGFRLGVRAKALFGVANLSNTKSELEVTTSEDIWTINSDMSFDASLGFTDITYDDEGNIEDIVVDEDLLDFNLKTIREEMFNPKNMGFGVDLGVTYEVNDWLQLSASVLDLGFINWSNEVTSVDYAITYDYEGLEMNPGEFLSGENSIDNYFDSLLTSLADTFMHAVDIAPGDPFMAVNNTKLYVGASFHLSPKISFGLLSRTNFLKYSIAQQFTASANFTTGRFLNLSLSYSYSNAYYKNLGFGLSMNLGPLNMYVITDNALNVVFWPQEARSANIWFGLNFAIGYKDKAMDLPLVQ